MTNVLYSTTVNTYMHVYFTLIKLFRAVLWTLFHLTSTSLNSNLTSHTTDHIQELNSVRFAARYWCIPVLPGARFSRWIGYCYTHCYNVAAACFSCPRGKATTITRYLTPGMRIIPGEPRQKTCILPIFKQGRVLLWQPGTPGVFWPGSGRSSAGSGTECTAAGRSSSPAEPRARTGGPDEESGSQSRGSPHHSSRNHLPKSTRHSAVWPRHLRQKRAENTARASSQSFWAWVIRGRVAHEHTTHLNNSCHTLK